MSSTPLPRSLPDEQGVSAAGTTAFRDALETFGGVHSMMVVRHGKVIAEDWWMPGRPETPHILHSISKSFTSTAAGFAIAEGLFGLDDRVIDLLADRVPDARSGALDAVTVRHLLTMTGGWGEETIPQEERAIQDSWTRRILGKPLVYEPGSTFQYNSGSTYLVSAIVQHTSGERVDDYLRPRLFAPLGIDSADWAESPEGVTTGGWGLQLTTEDLARFGLFCLGEGSFQGRRLLSSGWMREATSYQVANSRLDPTPDWAQGYGFQFWRCRHGAFRADGAFGQFCIMLPDQDAVVVLTADLTDLQGELDLVWEHLLPAFVKAS